MDFVKGKLPKDSSSNSKKFKQKLADLGYEFSESVSELNFSKPGRLEAVLKEIQPLAEEAGWNIWSELNLIQESDEKAAGSKYENGRIIREFQRG